MATEKFFLLFESDSKTIHRSLLQNFYICSILIGNLFAFFGYLAVCMNVTSGVTQLFFHQTIINGAVLDFYTD